jgi:hypothetical protein
LFKFVGQPALVPVVSRADWDELVIGDQGEFPVERSREVKDAVLV